MLGPRSLLVTAATVAAGVSAAPASAVTVSVWYSASADASAGVVPGYVLAVVGGPEADDVQVRLEAGILTVHSAAAPVSADGDCDPVRGDEVTCALRHRGAVVQLAVTGGDGGDRLTVVAPEHLEPAGQVEVDGGPGDDVVTGGAEQDVLDGGAGDDTLAGGDGDDRLRGGPGRDALDGGAGADTLEIRAGDVAGGDVLGGGAGRDHLDLLNTPTPMVVDLGAGAVTTTDASATLSGIEGAVSVASRATLRGGPGPDALASYDGGVVEGLAGDDVLRSEGRGGVVRGGTGDDELAVGPGVRAYGGPGADRIFGVNREVSGLTPWTAAISCGSGDDVVGFLSRTLVPRDCERQVLAGVGVVGSGHVAGGLLRVAIQPAMPACALVVRAVRGRQAVAHTRHVPVRHGASVVVARLRLTPFARSRLARGDLRSLGVVVGRVRNCSSHPLRIAAVQRARIAVGR